MHIHQLCIDGLPATFPRLKSLGSSSTLPAPPMVAASSPPARWMNSAASCGPTCARAGAISELASRALASRIAPRWRMRTDLVSMGPVLPVSAR